jgi:hypothetical protein
MSRGPGRIERELVSILNSQSGYSDAFALAAAVYHVQPDKDGNITLNDAQLVSVRRALNSLQRAGKAYRLGRGKRVRWTNERIGLWATIRETQRKNGALRDAGKTEALEAMMLSDNAEWAALLERADALGIDYYTATPPLPLKEEEA